MGRSLIIWGAALLLPLSYTGIVEAASPSASSVTLTRSGSLQAGNTLTFQAQALDWHGAPEYQFWLENATGWHMVQNYSSNAHWSMVATRGSYAVTVYAMNASQISGGYWNDALSATSIANVDSTVTLTTPPTGTQYQALSFTAQATNLIHPMYQFWVENPNGVWQGMDYSTKGVDQFNPSAPGTYHVIVYAKDPIAAANATDSVWSQTETLTVAPAVPQAANLTTYLANPLPGFRNPNAVLLGDTATITAVVTNAAGAPLANVPVVFTATNDANPSDHVSFGNGLSGAAVTNANGVVTTTLTVTNPEDGDNRQLALDSNALTIIGYSASIPSDPALAPSNNTVRFVALNPPALSLNGESVPHAIAGTVGTALTVNDSSSYLVPTAATTAPYTLPLNTSTGSYQPMSHMTLPSIAVNTPFTAATLNVSHLGLSTGSAVTIQFTPNGSTSPQYTRTISGPVSLSNFGVQIPAQSSPGMITATLTAPGETNPATAIGLSLTSLSVTPSGQPGSFIQPITGSVINWQTVPIQYTAPASLSSGAASSLLGSLYQSQWSYTSAVPVYPESGYGLITATDLNTVQAQYAYPTQNNGSDQNVLAATGTPVALPANPMVTPTITTSATGTSFSAGSPGLSEIQGTLMVPNSNPVLTEQPTTMFHEEILWQPGTTAPTLQYAWAGQTATITATLRNASGTPLANSTAFQWNVTGSGYIIGNEGTTTNSQGQATLTLTSANPATATISATATNGGSISLSDAAGSFQVTNLNWLAPTLSYMSPQGTVVGNGQTAPTGNPVVGSTQDFMLTAEGISATGQQIPIPNATPTVSQSTSSVGHPTTPTMNTNGAMMFQTTSTVFGAEDLTATLNIPTMINGQVDVGIGTLTPETITIPLDWQPGLPQASLQVSTLTPAVGTTVSLTPTLKDGYGNAVPGVPVTFAVSGGSATLSAVTSTTNSNGMASSSLSDGIAGETDIITVTIPTGQTIQQAITWRA